MIFQTLCLKKIIAELPASLEIISWQARAGQIQSDPEGATLSIKIGINGLGRIGRCVLRAWKQNPVFEIGLINDLGDAKTLGHLLRYDSVHGPWPADVKADEQGLCIDGIKIPISKESDPGRIPWKQHGVDLVLECTGFFTNADKAKAHIEGGGAKKVIISAPAQGQDVTLVLGVNLNMYQPLAHHIISNASCTTYCLAPVARVLMESFGIVSGLMTTIHSYTNDQKLLDLAHRDLRRSRAAALSMIPTTTGAAKALSEVLPALKGKLDGYALRVPTPNVSLLDLTVRLEKPASVSSVNDAFLRAKHDPSYQGVLDTSDQPLVSCDYNGNLHSATIDLLSTQVSLDLVKVLAWYDNEMAYAHRLYQVAHFVATQGFGGLS